MHTREGTTIVIQQEKVTNETRQQMNNLFQRLCSVRSFLLSRKDHQLFATGSCHFRNGQAKLSQAQFYSIHFLKVRHFPGKIDNIPLPGVFLEASLPLQQTFKKVLCPILIWRGTSRDFVARLSASRPKSSLKLDSAVISIGSSLEKLCHILANFLDCRSLLISKLTLCKTILSPSFVLESRATTDMLFFFSFGGNHFQNPGKNSEHNTYRPRFLSNCVISLVQQRYAYQVTGIVNDQLK